MTPDEAQQWVMVLGAAAAAAGTALGLFVAKATPAILAVIESKRQQAGHEGVERAGYAAAAAYAKALQEAVREAQHPNSPGGKEITQAEILRAQQHALMKTSGDLSAEDKESLLNGVVGLAHRTLKKSPLNKAAERIHGSADGVRDAIERVARGKLEKLKPTKHLPPFSG